MKIVTQSIYNLYHQFILFILFISYSGRIQLTHGKSHFYNKQPVSINFNSIFMLKKIATSLAAATSLAYAFDHFTQSHIVERNFRTAKCLLYILYSYKLNFNEENYLQVHESVAQAIYNMCLHNDGLYVKFGEALATLDYILPPPIYNLLSKLEQHTKKVSYKQIAAVFEEDLEMSIEQSFQSFEVEPVASGSLAQVHRAVLKDGKQVAVKIQKPYISRQIKSDMKMWCLITWILQKSFDLPFLSIAQNIQENILKEIDFVNEAQNTKKTKRNLQELKRNQIYVPQIYDQFTTKRVLVTEWIDGFKITNTQKLNQHNFDKKIVMNHLIRTVYEQLFISGFIHCDPHPGNIFVRANPQNIKQPQIVLLDLGLCLEINEQFRKQYTQFWKCMFFNDKKGVERICKEWKVKYYPQLAGWQILLPSPKLKKLSAIMQTTSQTKFQKFIRLQLEMKESIEQLIRDTVNVPKELIYIIRRQNLLRNLHRYHGEVADRVPILMKTVFMGTTIDRTKKPPHKLWVYLQMIGLNVTYYVMRIFDWLWTLLLGRKIQNYVQGQFVKRTQKLFRNYGFTQFYQLYHFDWLI